VHLTTLWQQLQGLLWLLHVQLVLLQRQTSLVHSVKV
jgi:hypothetical protein